MLNAPSVLYDAIEPIYDQLLNNMQSDIDNMVSYVSIASAIVIFLTVHLCVYICPAVTLCFSLAIQIVLVVFGLRPMISRM